MQKKDQPAVAKRKPTEHYSSEKKNGTKKFKSEHHLCVFCKEPKHKAEFSNSQLKKGSNGMCNDCKNYANRVCSRCKRLKSAQDFSKSQRNKLPHETKCKNCIQDIYPSGTLPKDAYYMVIMTTKEAEVVKNRIIILA